MKTTRLPLRRLVALVLAVGLVLPAVLAVPPARAVPAAPQLLTPSNYDTTTVLNYPPNGTPTFIWAKVTGADRYHIEIDTSPGFPNPRWTETYATSYTPDRALADATWYWHVRAHDPQDNQWGAWSDTWRFTKSWAAYGAVTPTLLEPAADANVEFFEYPFFTWTPVTGTAYYRFVIATESSCSAVAYTRNTMKPTHTPTSRLSPGEYYWKVTPVDHQDNQGSPSVCRRFVMVYQRVPTLLAPNDASHQTFTPEFRWTAVKGAKEYNLQVSTTPDFTTLVLNVLTQNSRCTPDSALENDKEYYWRVAARDMTNSAGPWSEVRNFYMEWHLRPQLLSPRNNYSYLSFPVYEWTPVAGAKRYRVWTDVDNPPAVPVKWEATPVNSVYDHDGWGVIYPDVTDYYWHVRGEDNRGNYAWWSDAYSLKFSWESAPTPIYPTIYYDPATVSSTMYLDVRTDPTVAVPVFMWDRVVHGYVSSNQQFADSYEIQVDDDQNFTSVDWTTRTANLSIVPSVESPWQPTPGVIYHWRVRPYRGGNPWSQWSEVWKARFDPTLQSPTTTLELYFPQEAMDSVYDTPLFGWSPVQGAAQYHFQIDTSTDFASPRHEGHPLYNFYTPQERLEPETYYWRVRAQDGGGGYIGDWTAPRRLVITHPLRQDVVQIANPCINVWPLPHPINNDSTTRVAQDPSGDAFGGAPYDLTGLYVGLARYDCPAGNWFWNLAIDLPYTNSTDMYFVFYVDLDHQPNSGGTTDPEGMSVTADPIYRPERVLVAHHNTLGEIETVYLYEWQGSSWGPRLDLRIDLQGDWDWERGQWLELKIPFTQFNIGETWLGTVSVEVFAAPAGGQAYDTVPSETGNPPASNLSNFTAVSDKVNPLHPWHNVFSNPIVYQQSPALSFSKPVYRSYVCGYRVQVARDIGFTEIVLDENYFAAAGDVPVYWHLGTRWTWWNSFPENNTLYWRVRPAHDHPSNPRYGPWTQPVRFTKFNYVPLSLTAAYTYTTPTFRWDRVEGAASYLLEVDDDPNYGSLAINREVDNTGYTWQSSLADRTWYWRVRTRDGSGNLSSYVDGDPFTKEMETPTLITPTRGVALTELPTLQWQGVLYPEVDPVVSSPRYHFILDSDINFSPPYVAEVTDMNSTSWTPELIKVEDGWYFWMVRVRDASGNPGPYTAVGTFYKGYLTPTPLAASFDPVPNLTWAPLMGAAYYQVQVCRDVYFSDCFPPVNTDQTNYVATTRYGAGMYYWQVRMCDATGVCGPYYQGQVGPRALIYLPAVFKRW